LKKTSKQIDEMVEMIIEEHEQAPNAQKGQQKDFVDILLSLMHQPMDFLNEFVIDRTNIKAILIDMVSGALETSATTIEWAFLELLRHPRVMENLQHELENVIGMSKMVEEADLPNLRYLDMVVKETLRLYPSAPLLVPRESSQDVMIDGYYIKKKSRIIVNAWAIGRDHKVWSDNAEMFYPERFVNSDIDLKGHHFELIPFGSGRRKCPGLQLGLTMVKLVLAQLVHCFKWELPRGRTPNDLDMTEKFGLSMPRIDHLLTLPTYRLANQGKL